MELRIVKWEDSNGPNTNDGYLGWGWQLNIGKINLGWLPAFEGDVFDIAVSTIDNNSYKAKKYSLSECIKIVSQLLIDEGESPEFFCETIIFEEIQYKVEVKPWMGNVPHLFVNDIVTAHVHRPKFKKSESIMHAINDYLTTRYTDKHGKTE